MTYIKKHLPLLIVNTVLVALLFVIVLSKGAKNNSNIQRDQHESYPFTSPIIDCQNIDNDTSVAISMTKFRSTVEALEEKYQLNRSSVYYRDLSNGQWIGINERETFSPASMMKTPVFIAFLKSVEENPSLLKKEVVATQNYFDYNLAQNFSSTTKIELGKTYTLQEVAEIMIKNSDNVATVMLSSNIKESDFNNIFKSIGIEFEKDKGDALIRIKDFASFFRILYNASYLNRDMSEFALSILSETTFKAGISAGVPDTTVVAHKFGERVVKNLETKAVTEQQLHDCGIVYHPKTPYILCVMTQGQDLTKQSAFIADISRYVYASVSESE
jgi:beta-lactamase class A